MVDVAVSVSADDNCDAPAVVLESVESNEADDGDGDGSTVDDIQGAEIGTADFAFLLRAERAGGGDGRIYTTIYAATDASGNRSTAGGFIVVPHDRSGSTDPIAIGCPRPSVSRYALVAFGRSTPDSVNRIAVAL